jgi:hypothetical protein
LLTQRLDLSIGSNHDGQDLTGAGLAGHLAAPGQAQTGSCEVAVEQADAVLPVVAFWVLPVARDRRASHAVEVLCDQFEPLTVAVTCCPESGGVSVGESTGRGDDANQRGDATDCCCDVGEVGPGSHGFEAYGSGLRGLGEGFA